MAISSVSRLESDHTPPTTPSTTAIGSTTEPLESHPKMCISKNCIHKKDAKESGDEAKSRKSKHVETDSDSSSDDSDSSDEDSESETSSEDEKKKRRKKSKSKKEKKSSKDKRKKSKSRRGKNKKSSKSGGDDSDKEETTEQADAGTAESVHSTSTSEMGDLKSLAKKSKINLKLLLKALANRKDDSSDDDSAKSVKSSRSSKSDKSAVKEKKKKVKVASKCEFKRLDEIWDDELYDYKLKETVEDEKADKYEEYIFTVRRKFDDEGHLDKTVVYIKSVPLKECLQTVMEDVDNVSLVEDTPNLDPNMLFLFLEEFRSLVDQLKSEAKTAKRKKARKAADAKSKHLEVLVSYLDKDYDETKKRLNPLLASGRISFDLMWALFKPNDLAYTSTYRDEEQPRAIKIVSSYMQKSYSRGTYWEIEGKYLDFDGKSFGTAETYADVSAFQGTRKITSLACYPLQYHQDVVRMKTQLLERGKKFLTLAGMNYQLYKGFGYVKKDEKFLKASVNGRIMLDPGTFRRINPNYPLNDVSPRDFDDLDEDGDCCCTKVEIKKNEQAKRSTRLFRLMIAESKEQTVVEVDLTAQEDLEKHVDSEEKENAIRNTFTEEELLTASAVLPGFSFSEKTWLEFAVSHVSDVTWNDGAFESLVLPEKHKTIVKALVSAHALHSSKGIDDVIAGKGKGLVAVLHGRPGLGKTLTCEAVSDLLRRPLYTVSAGDLGTNPTTLETELQAILDIAHTWGAVLLMDEADVFLEERSIHDVHRNALVSIFLRLLEYFQGILFLTTNRVETFDEAFVSRIHLSLRYGELTTKAKRSVWKTFIDKVAATDGTAVGEITEQDYADLARQDMNGRQIKNMVKTAQALALHEDVPMGMSHIRRVIDVAKSFEMDLKGGRGFEQAMMSYT